MVVHCSELRSEDAALTKLRRHSTPNPPTPSLRENCYGSKNAGFLLRSQVIQNQIGSDIHVIDTASMPGATVRPRLGADTSLPQFVMDGVACIMAVRCTIVSLDDVFLCIGRQGWHRCACGLSSWSAGTAQEHSETLGCLASTGR